MLNTKWLKRIFQALIFVVLISLISWKLWQWNHFQRLGQHAKEYYDNREFQKALDLISPFEDQMAQISEGCPLFLSVYAESKRFESLVSLAKECIQEYRVSDIGYEALAFGLTSQKKNDEAISTLLSFNDTRNATWNATLAHLYVFNEDWASARKFYLQALELDANPDRWLGRILRNQSLVSDEEFLKSLAKILSEKKAVDVKFVEIFIEKAKQMHLNDVAQDFQNRLSDHFDTNVIGN